MAREGQHDARLNVTGTAKSADRELRGLATRMQKFEREVEKSNVALAKQSTKLKAQAVAAKQSAGATQGLGAAMAGARGLAFGALAAVAAVDQLTSRTIDVANVMASAKFDLNQLAAATGNMATAFETAHAAALLSASGMKISQAEANKLFENTAKVADANGVDLVTALNAVNKGIQKGQPDRLRAIGLNVDMAFSLEKLRKQLGYASTTEIPLAIRQELALTEVTRALGDAAANTQQPVQGLAFTFEAFKNKAIDSLDEVLVKFNQMPADIRKFVIESMQDAGASAEQAASLTDKSWATTKEIFGQVKDSISALGPALDRNAELTEKNVNRSQRLLEIWLELREVKPAFGGLRDFARVQQNLLNAEATQRPAKQLEVILRMHNAAADLTNRLNEQAEAHRNAARGAARQREEMHGLITDMLQARAKFDTLDQSPTEALFGPAGLGERGDRLGGVGTEAANAQRQMLETRRQSLAIKQAEINLSRVEQDSANDGFYTQRVAQLEREKQARLELLDLQIQQAQAEQDHVAVMELTAQREDVIHEAQMARMRQRREMIGSLAQQATASAAQQVTASLSVADARRAAYNAAIAEGKTEQQAAQAAKEAEKQANAQRLRSLRDLMIQRAAFHAAAAIGAAASFNYVGAALHGAAAVAFGLGAAGAGAAANRMDASLARSRGARAGNASAELGGASGGAGGTGGGSGGDGVGTGEVPIPPSARGGSGRPESPADIPPTSNSKGGNVTYIFQQNGVLGVDAVRELTRHQRKLARSENMKVAG